MRYSLMASVIILSVFSTAHAKRIYRRGDWEIHDLSKDRRSTSNVCIALTQSEANRTDYQLQIVKDKSKGSLVQVYIHQKGRGAQGWIADLQNGQTLSFAKKSTDGRLDIFWNIPQNTAALIQQLKDRRDLRMRPADDTRNPRLEFSAKGFEKALSKMESKCFGGEQILNPRFELSFALNQGQVDPMRIGEDSVAKLQSIQIQAFEVFKNVDAKDAELKRLRARFQRELSEAESLENSIQRLSQYSIPTTIKRIQENDNLEATKKAELSRLIADIPKKANAKRLAQGQLNQAEVTIAPYLSEHESRSRSLREASQRQSMSSGRVQAARDNLSRSRSRLSALNNEVNRNQIENQRIQSELRNLNVNLRRARDAARRFNPSRVAAERLQRDRNFNQAEKELSAVEPHLRNLGRALRRADSDVLLKEAALRSCQNRQATIWSYGEFERLPAQTRPRRDGPSGRTRPGRETDGRDRERPNRNGNDDSNTDSNTETETTTDTPTPTPTVDCSREESALAQARSTRNDLNSQLQSSQNRRTNLIARMERARRDAEREAQREQAALNGRVNEIQRSINQAQGEFTRNERRNQVILSTHLPTEERNLRNSESELRNAEAQLAADNNEVARQSTGLRNFENRVGWYQKNQSVQNARSNLSRASRDLANAESLKRSTEIIISQCQSDRVRLSNELASFNQQKVNAEAQLQKVRVSLEPFEQEKARIDGEASVFKNELMRLAQDFEARL
jgi:DNA repair exonuclease SbcCD ATPase subunit